MSQYDKAMGQYDKYARIKQHRKLLVVSLRKQHRLFVREGLDYSEEELPDKLDELDHDHSYENWHDLSDVTDQFRFRLYLPIQIRPHELVMVFKNGVQQPNFLKPGRHILWNKDPFFTQYQLYRFNTQNVMLKALVDGRVHDPRMGLDLKVVAELRILCRLKHHERFLLGVNKPLRLFYTIFNDIVYEELAKLEHDLLGKWAKDLRDGVLRRLRANSSQEESEIERLIGIEVINVYVDSLSNNPEYVELQDENFAFKAEQWRNIAEAQAQREQAAHLGINPVHIRFANTEMGLEAMKGQMEVDKMREAFGLFSPSTPTNQLPESFKIDSQPSIFSPTTSPLYLINPPAPSSAAKPPPSEEDKANQGPEKRDDSLSEERKQQEIIALKRAGFIPEGKGGRNGSLGAECWGISVTTYLPNKDLLTISFRCDGYPYDPPKVYSFSREYDRQQQLQLESLLNWGLHMMLVDIAEEIRSTFSAQSAGEVE